MSALAADEIVLPAKDAKLAGPDAKYENAYKAICSWRNTNIVATWTVQIPAKGAYRVFLTYSTLATSAGNEAEITIGNQRAAFSIAATRGWDDYAEHDIGPVLLRNPGSAELSLKVTKIKTKVWNVRMLRLVKED